MLQLRVAGCRFLDPPPPQMWKRGNGTLCRFADSTRGVGLVGLKREDRELARRASESQRGRGERLGAPMTDQLRVIGLRARTGLRWM
jgi:hypothetical protein